MTKLYRFIIYTEKCKLWTNALAYFVEFVNANWWIDPFVDCMHAYTKAIVEF